MSNIETWIRSKLGCGYVYGATGWVCSEERRKQQAQQYPQYAENILGVCKQWDGKQCYDCAQLIRRALESVGMTGVPSGATSQYKKSSLWLEKGTIDTLPPTGLLVLSRESPAGSGTMQHTGWRMSDGTVIDARSSHKGVIASKVDSYKWTHWMRPAINHIEEEETMLYKAIVTTSKDPLRVREAPVTGRILGRVSKGREVSVLTEPVDGWCRIRYNELIGYASSDFLSEIEDTDGDADIRIPEITIIDDEGHTFTPKGNWRVILNA